MDSFNELYNQLADTNQQGMDGYMYDPNQQYYDGWVNVSTPQMQYVPNQDYLNNYADYYGNTQPNLADRYKQLANQAGIWGDTQRNILNWYDALANDVSNRQDVVTGMSSNLANDLLGDINNQRDYIYSLYWPEWSITQQVNDYYSALSNSLAGDTGRQLAQNDVNAREIGMSVGANRNAQNEIYNQWYQRSLQAMEQDINAKNQIVNQLQTYLTQFRQEYWDTTDKYLIQQYQKWVDLLNQIQSWLTEQMINLETAKLQNALAKMNSGWWGGWITKLTQEEMDSIWNYINQLALTRSEEDFNKDKTVQDWRAYYKKINGKDPTFTYNSIREWWNKNLWWTFSWFKAPEIYNGYTWTMADVLKSQGISQLNDGSFTWTYIPTKIEQPKETTK